MPSSSPSNSSRLTPKNSNQHPNANPFAPLSPDLPENRLSPSINASKPIDGKKVRIYTRDELLRVAKLGPKKGYPTPGDFKPLESWFGNASPVRTTNQLDDPAIASVGPQASGSRRGGYGEGFGYGVGIGGNRRGGARNNQTGQPRRQLEGDNERQTQPMGKFTTRGMNNNNNPEKLQRNNDNNRRREDNEWRRDKFIPRAQYANEDAEPAWMDDLTLESDPAIKFMDPLVQFTPGEDMIAKHKSMMKEKDQRWNASGPPSALHHIVDSKPKVFNSASYLLPSRSQPETIEAEQQTPVPAPVFASRFQRFFAPEAQASTSQQSPPLDDSKQSDHASRLMGLLSMSENRPSPPSASSFRPPYQPVLQQQQQQQQQHPVPPLGYPAHNTPQALLEQLYRGSSQQSAAPHPATLYGGHQRPPAAGGPPMRDAYGPPPGFFPGGPPFPSQMFPAHPPHMHQHSPPPMVMQQAAGARQQEILNTLFAGLGSQR